MLYRILIAPDRRFVRSAGEDARLEGFLAYLETVKNKYLSVLQPSEVRVTVDRDNRAHFGFLNFPGRSFSAVVATNQSVTLQSPNRQPIKVFIGGRDDAFFNDLPGFFRSINYARQFYHVPHTMPDMRELKIPKTFLEVQRGFLAFSRGGYPDARSHYQIAEAAYPGYWLVDEYKAELLGAEGRYTEAIETFQELAFASDRPDLQQAIAELYEFAEQPDAARHWQNRALDGYLQSA
jgi:tetratricopeptide (TPR) repeat protein